MPWTNQGGGGGGWQGGGGGGRGPWGQGPRGGGPTGGGGGGGGGPMPPNLEDLLRKGQDRMRGMMPGGNMSGRGVVLLFLAAIAVWMASGIYRVDTNEAGVVLRFGRFADITQPGLRWHWPWPIESVMTPRVTTVNREEIGFRSAGGTVNLRSGQMADVPEESLMLTGDENIVDIDFTVLWQVKDPQLYLFNVADVSRTIKQVAESAVREVVGKNPIQFTLTEGRTKIADDTRLLMQNVLDGYKAGVTINQVALQRTEPPASVIDAFRDVQAAQADRERTQNEAEAYRNDILPRARGEVQRILQQAEAYKQETIANAQGEAARFVSVYNEYKQAKDVTAKRMYLETMENILRGTNKVVLDQNASGQGVVPYLPLPELQKKK